MGQSLKDDSTWSDRQLEASMRPSDVSMTTWRKPSGTLTSASRHVHTCVQTHNTLTTGITPIMGSWVERCNAKELLNCLTELTANNPAGED